MVNSLVGGENDGKLLVKNDVGSCWDIILCCVFEKWIIMKFKIYFYSVGKWMVNSCAGGEKDGKFLGQKVVWYVVIFEKWSLIDYNWVILEGDDFCANFTKMQIFKCKLNHFHPP